jgi:hypothetical protein
MGSVFLDFGAALCKCLDPYSRAATDIFRFMLSDPVWVDAFGDALQPVPCVAIKFVGRLFLSQFAEVGNEVASREQGAEVVVAKHAPPPGQGVFV